MISPSDIVIDSPSLPPPPAEGLGGSKPRLLIQRTHAAFVSKLYAMVADASTDGLISWTAEGDCFKVTDPTEFARNVLPAYFKHGNWPSFVRQLNMYGFHKINDLAYGGIFGDTQLWMFKHPHFQRGELGQLQCIKRRGPKSSAPSAASAECSADADANIAAESSRSRSASPSSPAVSTASHPAGATEPCPKHERPATPEQLVLEPVSVTAQVMGDYVGDLKNCISELQQSNGQLRRENQEMRTAVQSCQSAFAGIMGFLEATIVQPCLRSGSPLDSRNTSADVVQAFRRLAGELAPLIAPRDYPPSSNPLPLPNSDCFPPVSYRAAAVPPSSSFLATLAGNTSESCISRKRRPSSGSDANSNASSTNEAGDDAALSPAALIVLPPISGIVDNIPSPSKSASRWRQYSVATSHQSSLRETLPPKRARPHN
ncbi:Flocculation suppression protein [Coemansia sp. BCRC 34301]|nr:Flocculation suppression protein [Coemansia sp. BCRC 34301]